MNIQMMSSFNPSFASQLPLCVCVCVCVCVVRFKIHSLSSTYLVDNTVQLAIVRGCTSDPQNLFTLQLKVYALPPASAHFPTPLSPRQPLAATILFSAPTSSVLVHLCRPHTW